MTGLSNFPRQMGQTGSTSLPAPAALSPAPLSAPKSSPFPRVSTSHAAAAVWLIVVVGVEGGVESRRRLPLAEAVAAAASDPDLVKSALRNTGCATHSKPLGTKVFLSERR